MHFSTQNLQVEEKEGQDSEVVEGKVEDEVREGLEDEDHQVGEVDKVDKEDKEVIGEEEKERRMTMEIIEDANILLEESEEDSNHIDSWNSSF